MPVAAAASPMAAPLAGAAETLELPTRATPIATSIANKMARIPFSCVGHVIQGGADNSARTPPAAVAKISLYKSWNLGAGKLVGRTLIIYRRGVHPLFRCPVGATDRVWANK